MSADELRQAITAVPFEPFVLRTADGRQVPVVNRDFILITPNRRHVWVFQPDNSRQVLDIMLVLGLEFTPQVGTNGTATDSGTSAA